MDIQRLPSGERWRAAWHDLLCAVRAADQPDLPVNSRQSTDASLTKGWPGDRSEHWVARDGDELLGIAELTLPQQDNLDNSWLDLAVHPAYRRRGVGTALLAAAVAQARAEGRKRVVADVVEPRSGGPERSPGPRAFAAKHGAKRALEEVRRRLPLSTVDQTRLDAALKRAWGHAAGYSLVRWTEAAPDDIVAGIAALDSDFLNQAPLGDMIWEAERVDVPRVRAIEQAVRDRGWRRCHIAARHDASGDVVAWTTLSLCGESDDHAWQHITLVRPDHRGHRLGTVIKLENLRFTRERFPALEVIDTCNASVNDHMVAINDLMGFQPVDLNVGWQLEL